MKLQKNSFNAGRKVLLIDNTNTNRGYVTFQYAFNEAKQIGIPLVLVKDADIPICKIMDIDKKNFDQKKNQKQQKIKTKEVQISSVMQEHDFDVKIKNIRKFLEKGYKVDVAMKLKRGEKFRGGIDEKRIDIFDRVYDRVSDMAMWENDVMDTKRTLVKI